MQQTGLSSRISWFGLLVCILACSYYYFFFFHRADVEIEISVPQKTAFKLYWAQEGQSFSEKRRAVVTVTPDRQRYRFSLTDLGSVTQLRLDPMEYAGEAVVGEISLRQQGWQPITVDLERVTPLHDIESAAVDERGLIITSTGNDPYLLIIPDLQPLAVNWLEEGARYALLSCAILLFVSICAPLRRDFTYVPLLLALVSVLVLTMAAVSRQNAHPDEYVHLQAAGYYADNWLPPRVDDPAIEQTYSVYGVSRLNNGEIYYLLVGKLAKLVQAFNVPELFSLRLFNIVLFAVIVLYAAASVPARMVAVVFLLSPQIWYLFSYCVSDAFGLFICFLAACEAIRPQSCLNRFLFDPDYGRGQRALAGVWLTVLLALLLLLKINYYPFIAFLAVLVCWHVFRSSDREQRRAGLLRIGALILVAGLLAGVRIGADYYVNGLDRQEKVAAMQEKTAHHWYKPSTELHKKHIGLFLKQRGTTLPEMIKNHRWFEHTLQSGVGMYGYFTIAAPELYYQLFKWLLAIFLAVVLTTLLVRGGAENALLTLLAVALTLALLGAALHRSWTVDFQAQGRYLFPMLPMFGVLLAKARHLFDSRVFILCVAHLFILSLYSFVFIALPAIPRPG
jgi:hypothetical protein